MQNRLRKTNKRQLAVLLLTLIFNPFSGLNAQTFEAKFDSINAYGWFGGDDRTARHVGVGQGVFIDTSITLDSFSFYFRGPFDRATTAEGHGHQVTLVLNVRDSLGVILHTTQVVVADTFKAGWVTWSNIALDVDAGTTLIFTTYVIGAMENKYTASHAAHAQAGYAFGLRYGKDGVSDADMESWTDWSVHPSWDSVFWLQGTIRQTTGVTQKGNAEPVHYELRQNYPNPFNPSTVIRFHLPAESEVSLMIYSLSGQLVKQVARGKVAGGKHEVVWDGRDERGMLVASGNYFYKLTAGDFQSTRRMLFVK